jgi:hypothetical protein
VSTKSSSQKNLPNSIKDAYKESSTENAALLLDNFGNITDLDLEKFIGNIMHYHLKSHKMNSKAKMKFVDDNVIIEYSNFPLKTVYTFKKHPIIQRKNKFILRLSITPTSRVLFGSTVLGDMTLTITIRSKSIKLSTRTSSVNMPLTHHNEISLGLLSYVRTTIQNEIEIYQSRKKQAEAIRNQILNAKEKLRLKELDKTLHPEKYRTKMSASTRAGNSDGSSRFIPSAATQARRQRSRGG